MFGEGDAGRAADLIDVTSLDDRIRIDVRYARSDNFLGRPLYSQARVLLRRPVAAAVVRAHRRLAAEGFGLLIFDGYRPLSVTRLFWELAPPELRRFLADPAQGSRHNRGAAVDASLFDLATGAEVAMPCPYDEFSERAAPDYAGGDLEARRRRDLLRSALEAEEFTVADSEWWHFDHRSWREFSLLDLPIEQIP